MRLVELYLPAFGAFSGQGLDFAGAEHGLHIVYGPNEAGKSTALRALSCLLWGFPNRSTDGFQHGNSKLRVGAAMVDEAGQGLVFVRRKGRKSTLRTVAEEPLDDAVLSGFLGGLTQEIWSHLFGIDHDELERGAEQMLAGDGEIGRVLYSAALGGANCRQLLDELEAEAKELFLPRAKKNSAIQVALGEYRDARRAVRDLSMRAESWRDLRDAVETSAADVAQLRQKLAELERRRRSLERDRHALARIVEWGAQRTELGKLTDVRELHPGFAEERREAEAALARAHKERASCETEARSIAAALAELDVADELLAHGEVIEDLRQRVEPHRAAVRQVEESTREEARFRATIDVLAAESPFDVDTVDAGRLRVALACESTVLELTDGYERGVAKRDSQSAEIDELQRDLVRAEARLRDAREASDPSDLAAAIEAVPADLEDGLDAARAALDQREGDAAAALARLPGFRGALSELEAAVVPSVEALDASELEFAALAARRKSLVEKRDDLEAETASARRQLDELERVARIPTEDDLRVARSRREEGWRHVRAAWLEDADETEQSRTFRGEDLLDVAYRAAVDAADEVADRLRHEADRVATRAGLEARGEDSRSRLAKIDAELEALDSERGRASSAWCAKWEGACDEPGPPHEMRSWLRAYQDLVAAARDIRERQAKVVELTARVERHRGDLVGALRRTGDDDGDAEPTSFRALLARAHARLDVLKAAREERRELESELRLRRVELETRRESLDRLAAVVETARVDWCDALRSAGLDACGSPDAVRDALRRMRDYVEAVDQLDRVRAERARAEKAVESFETAVAREVGVLRSDLALLPAVDAVIRLHAAWRQGAKDATVRATKSERAEALTLQLASIREEIASSSKRLESLCDEAGCEKPVELARCETAWSRVCELRKRVGQLECELVEDAGGEELEAYAERLAGVEADELDVRQNRLAEEIAALEAERSHAEQELGRRQNELERVDGSARAADAAEAQTAALAKIRDGTERWIRLRLAARIVRDEVERYRREHQAPILERAGAVFARLTADHFVGLRAESEGDDVVIEAVRPSRETVRVDGMSDGTRDQLYLALRLASLEQHLESHPPMPFVVDDILVNFDDDRARRALEVLAEFAARTQVIFFTHHPHLVALAREAVSPDVLCVPSFVPLEQLALWRAGQLATT